MTEQVASIAEEDLSTASSTTHDGPALIDVVRRIPESCYERSTTRGLLFVVRDFVIYAALIYGLINVHAWWLVVPMWLVTGLCISGIFVLGHDASHNALFDSRRLNAVIARIAMLPSAHIESAWDFGHNRVHHGHTVKQEMISFGIRRRAKNGARCRRTDVCSTASSGHPSARVCTTAATCGGTR